MTTEHDSIPGAEGPSPKECSHHWVIEAANGPVSRGVCQMCKEVREFKNSIGWEYWQGRPGRAASS